MGPGIGTCGAGKEEGSGSKGLGKDANGFSNQVFCILSVTRIQVSEEQFCDCGCCLQAQVEPSLWSKSIQQPGSGLEVEEGAQELACVPTVWVHGKNKGTKTL